MRVKHISTFTLFLVMALFVGCKQNPIDRLLGKDHDSPSNEITIPEKGNPSPAPEINGVVGFVLGDTHALGEIITIGLINNRSEVLTLPTPNPWIIEDELGNVVDSRNVPQVIEHMQPGEVRHWAWDQKNNDGVQVPAGDYAVRFEIDPSCQTVIRVPFEIRQQDCKQYFAGLMLMQGAIPQNSNYSIFITSPDVSGTVNYCGFPPEVKINVGLVEALQMHAGGEVAPAFLQEATLRLQIDTPSRVVKDTFARTGFFPIDSRRPDFMVRVSGTRQFGNGETSSINDTEALAFINENSLVVVFRDAHPKINAPQDVFYLLEMGLQ